MNPFFPLVLTAGVATALAGRATGQDLVIPSGITLFTNGGTLVVDSLTIETGGTLFVQGSSPLKIQAHDRIVIDGTLNASGASAPNVATINTGQIPEFGAAGVGGGGYGGTASILTTASTPQGLDGSAPFAFFVPSTADGGRGGESGYGTGGKNSRRPGGGGGGTLALGDVSQTGPAGGTGLVPGNGQDGHPMALGAISGQSPPKGRRGLADVLPGWQRGERFLGQATRPNDGSDRRR